MEESDSDVSEETTQKQDYMPEEVKPERSGFSKERHRGSFVIAAAGVLKTEYPP
jgi:hypothetical protein